MTDIYENGTFVLPTTRLNEIRAFVERGLDDFSISRLASKMPWGVPVPGDESQVMYVWFDALVNYISAIGWPDRPDDFKKWWVDSGGVVQYCGKDNLRQQAAMWQAMLLGTRLPPSKTIVINGWVTGEGGVKMSKSLGNTIDPFDVVKEFGTEALRYFVARELGPHEDGSFTMAKFKEAYNAHLANGLGNLVSRTMKMSESNGIVLDGVTEKRLADSSEMVGLMDEYEYGFDSFDLQRVSNAVWGLISSTDKIIQDRQPFKKIKTDRSGAEADIKELLSRLKTIGIMLAPILPETSEKIAILVKDNKMPEVPLFARK